MRKLPFLLIALALPALLSGCRDNQARADIQATRDVLKDRSEVRHEFDMRVVNALCNLDVTVQNWAAADTTLTIHKPEWFYCAPGHPEPDPPPDPIRDPW